MALVNTTKIMWVVTLFCLLFCFTSSNTLSDWLLKIISLEYRIKLIKSYKSKYNETTIVTIFYVTEFSDFPSRLHKGDDK